MSNFLADFGIDFDDVKEAGFDVEDGFYSFVTSGGRIQNGTSTDANAIKFVIDYNLFDDNDEAVGQKGEWFTVAERDEDGNAVVTDKAKKSLPYLKTRLIELGFPGGNINGIDLDALEGITGTLQVKTRDGYQNVRNVKINTEINKAALPVKKATTARTPATSAPAKPNPFKGNAASK